jgi:hypothetical protein
VAHAGGRHLSQMSLARACAGSRCGEKRGRREVKLLGVPRARATFATFSTAGRRAGVGVGVGEDDGGCVPTPRAPVRHERRAPCRSWPHAGAVGARHPPGQCHPWRRGDSTGPRQPSAPHWEALSLQRGGDTTAPDRLALSVLSDRGHLQGGVRAPKLARTHTPRRGGAKTETTKLP